MKPSEIFTLIEGRQGEVCDVTLKNGELLRDRILYGTQGNDFGGVFLVISEGKSRTSISASDIQSIEIK